MSSWALFFVYYDPCNMIAVIIVIILFFFTHQTSSTIKLKTEKEREIFIFFNDWFMRENTSDLITSHRWSSLIFILRGPITQFKRRRELYGIGWSPTLDRTNGTTFTLFSFVINSSSSSIYTFMNALLQVYIRMVDR